MKKVFVADFETSTESWLTRDNGWARVWYGTCATLKRLITSRAHQYTNLCATSLKRR